MAFPELAMSCTYRLVRPDRSLSLQGWGLIDLPLRALFQFLISFPGVAWPILDCARRTSTFLSCAFREQEDDQVTLPILRRPRVARAQKIISLHPLPYSGRTGILPASQTILLGQTPLFSPVRASDFALFSRPHFQQAVNRPTCLSPHPEQTHVGRSTSSPLPCSSRSSLARSKSASFTTHNSGNTSTNGTSPARLDPC